MELPRKEHPMPQWERNNWMNLNGTWEFEFDFGSSAIARNRMTAKQLEGTIVVPFCPESRLSGIGYTDFIPGVIYRRHFTLTKEQLGGNVLLHFGAVDYEAVVYVNGMPAGSHTGGYTSFSFDITDLVREGDNQLFVAVRDDVRSGLQPKGKQAHLFASSGCDYTRTTGIWQTVWLEFLPASYVCSARFYPDPDNARLTVTGITRGSGTLVIEAFWEGIRVGEVSLLSHGGFFAASMDLSEVHLWEAGKGGLYQLLFHYGEDEVKSYFGLRTAVFDGRRFLLNGKPLFQRFVLDQGFYPEGIYTAPSDADLIRDITLSMDAGFNGARLHQKVFEPRFLYHCDQMGYLVWGEYPNWGLDHASLQATEIYLNEWREAVERDFNHPSIIGWCPFNETWGYEESNERNRLLSSIYYLTKQLDPTRPCIDTSGNFHAVTEIYDIHDYDQDPASFGARWTEFVKRFRSQKDCIEKDDDFFRSGNPVHGQTGPFFAQPYHGQPIFVSEYGGIFSGNDNADSWGYGQAPASKEEYYERYRGLTEALLNNPEIFGFCYTQLYDIEQECNGLYAYDRTPKCDIAKIRSINQQVAAIEQ
ncbi:MAG: beta-galactosidase [Fusicatenibacter sp.]|nr:beta-galactosidase [Fusicatenibacter sp.]